jgi:hypothetical protein
MVNSRVDICNLALNSLGENQISSLDDLDDVSVICNLHYYPLLDEALRRHDWLFATMRQTLADSADTNNTIYEYNYTLPEDPYCLKVLKLLDENNVELDREDYPYIIEGRTLYTDLEDAKIKYIGRVTDVTDFDAAFALFFAEYMAWKLAYRITGDARKESMAEVRQARAFDEARAHDLEEAVSLESTTSWTAPWGE